MCLFYVQSTYGQWPCLQLNHRITILPTGGRKRANTVQLESGPPTFLHWLSPVLPIPLSGSRTFSKQPEGAGFQQETSGRWYRRTRRSPPRRSKRTYPYTRSSFLRRAWRCGRAGPPGGMRGSTVMGGSGCTFSRKGNPTPRALMHDGEGRRDADLAQTPALTVAGRTPGQPGARPPSGFRAASPTAGPVLRPQL